MCGDLAESLTRGGAAGLSWSTRGALLELRRSGACACILVGGQRQLSLSRGGAAELSGATKGSRCVVTLAASFTGPASCDSICLGS